MVEITSLIQTFDAEQVSTMTQTKRPEERRIPPSLLWMETTQRPRWLSVRHPLRPRTPLDLTRKYETSTTSTTLTNRLPVTSPISSEPLQRTAVAAYTPHSSKPDGSTEGTLSHPVSETYIWQCFPRKFLALPVLPLLWLGLHVKIGLFTQCHLLCARGAAVSLLIR